MNRQIKEEYIPLKASPLGDHHKLALVLTPEQGLIRAAVFGAAGKKGGAMRALIQPFSYCRGEFYYDPVKKLWRLNEGECLENRESFSRALNKYFAALFWADLISQSHGGGGSREFFDLSKNVFHGLENAEPHNVPSLFLTFLWEYLGIEGIRPDLGSCSRCGRKAPSGRSLCYASDGQIVCSRCRMEELPVLSAEARIWLESLSGGNRSRTGPIYTGERLADAELKNASVYILGVIRSLLPRMKMDENSIKFIFK